MVKPVTKLEQRILSSYTLKPHPDGKPWTKCCGSSAESQSDDGCTCFMRRSQTRHGVSRFEDMCSGTSAELLKAKGRFFCVHRTDKGYNRECAGWFAKFGRHR